MIRLLFLILFPLGFLSADSGQKAVSSDSFPKEIWFAGKNLTELQKQEFRKSSPAYGAILRADKILTKKFSSPFPEQFLEFQKNGTRIHFQTTYQEFSTAAAMLATAWYVTGDRKYLNKLDEIIQMICKFPTWVLPAHDKKLLNFTQKTVEIDLASSLLGWRLATIYSHFKNDLPPQTANLLKKELEKRILAPFRAVSEGKQKPFWWMERRMNWNAVCLAGITGTVLAMEENQKSRTQMLQTVIRYIPYFLESFSDDGYCSEGAAYWNYGFGHYLYLTAMISIATNGRINLLKQKNSKAAAEYSEKIVMGGGWVPAFADCSLKTKIAPQYTELYRLLTQKTDYAPPRGWFPEIFLPVELSRPEKQKEKKDNILPPLSIFPIGGVAVMRPETKSECRLAAAVKGGHNDELHNHNDVGSYTILVDATAPVVADPGAEIYTSTTFGKQRYDNPVMNSFGHSVPRPAGELQTAGPDTAAILLEERRMKDSFRWHLDLRRAYRVPTLEILERQFDYSRRGTGSFTVTDRVQFSRPETFETAIVSPGTIKNLPDGRLEIEFEKKILFAEINTNGIPFELIPEPVKGNFQGGVTPVRIGIRLKNPIRNATVSVTFVPK